MVVYAVAADVSIIRIFLAGFLPGLPADGAVLRLHRRGGRCAIPDKTPPPDAPMSFVREALRASGNLIPCALLIVFIVWVLVAGWATATECAAYGVLGSLAIAGVRAGSLTWQQLLGRPDGRDARLAA